MPAPYLSPIGVGIGGGAARYMSPKFFGGSGLGDGNGLGDPEGLGLGDGGGGDAEGEGDGGGGDAEGEGDGGGGGEWGGGDEPPPPNPLAMCLPDLPIKLPVYLNQPPKSPLTLTRTNRIIRSTENLCSPRTNHPR